MWKMKLELSDFDSFGSCLFRPQRRCWPIFPKVPLCAGDLVTFSGVDTQSTEAGEPSLRFSTDWAAPKDGT